MLRMRFFTHIQKADIYFATPASIAQKRFCSTKESNYVWHVSQDKLTCSLKVNAPIKKKIWQAANIRMGADNFTWNRENKCWTGPFLPLTEKTGMEVKSLLEEYARTIDNISSKFGKNKEKENNLGTWAESEEQHVFDLLKKNPEGKYLVSPKRSAEFFKVYYALDQADDLHVDMPDLIQAEAVTKLITEVDSIINSLLPKGINHKRFKSILFDVLEQQENLFRNEMASIRKCIFTASLLGLEPDNIFAMCYFIPIDGQLRFVMGYRGLMELAFRTNLISHFSAKCVYKEDHFNVTKDEIKHTPHLHVNERGPIAAVYAICTFKDGHQVSTVLDSKKMEVLSKLAKSKQNEHSVWEHWSEEMYMKSAIKMLIRNHIQLLPEDTSSEHDTNESLPEHDMVKPNASL